MNERDKELAVQAGVGDTWNKADWYSISPEMLEKFAALIRADEREACAKTVEMIETYEKIEKACFKFAAKTIRARGNT